MKNILIISLYLLLLTLCSCSKKTIPASEQNDTVSVRKMEGDGLAKLARKIRPDFLLGSFASSGVNMDSPDKYTLRNIFREQFNITTIGVYMGTTQPQSQSFNFTNIDDVVYFARYDNIVIYMHPLIGGSQYTSNWVNNGNFSASELKQIMKDRITTILTRYRGKVKYVDVVNEALAGMNPDSSIKWSTNGNVWIKMGWHDDANGKWPIYLEEAFRDAREAGDSSLKLIYNDNGNELMESRISGATLKLFKDFRKAGVPIDGIGMQFHCGVANGMLREGASGTGPVIDFGSFSRNMRRYADAGVEIHITEFDVHLPDKPSESDYSIQANAFREVLKRCLEEPACKSFKMWGFTDKYGWRPGIYNPHELMLNEFFEPKKAYWAMKDMLEEKIRAIH